MSSTDRLKQYAKPLAGPQGASRDPANLDYWSNRAKAESHIAPRASDGPMKLPDTGKKMNNRDTGMRPYAKRDVAAAMAGDGDLNHVGDGPFMRSVRRQA